MKRISTLNRVLDLFGVGKDGFRNGNKAAGVDPTEFDADWCNSIQEELAAFPEHVGAALDPNNRHQALDAVVTMIEARVGDFALDTGTANAKVIALNPAIAAYTGNFGGSFKNAVLNTGACTINAGGGAVALVNDAGAALVAGDLPAGAIVTYQYIHADAKAYVTSLVLSQALTQAAADARYAALLPGQLIEFAGTAAPAGFLVCPTAAANISRTTYAALFAAIGTTWGAGDGSTTFGIPWFPADYASVQASANVGTQTTGSVIAHSHISSASSSIGTRPVGGGVQESAVVGSSTGTTGGAANFAAGVRVLRCVKY